MCLKIEDPELWCKFFQGEMIPKRRKKKDMRK